MLSATAGSAESVVGITQAMGYRQWGSKILDPLKMAKSNCESPWAEWPSLHSRRTGISGGHSAVVGSGFGEKRNGWKNSQIVSGEVKGVKARVTYVRIAHSLPVITCERKNKGLPWPTLKQATPIYEQKQN
jgi:hypothetical protein